MGPVDAMAAARIREFVKMAKTRVCSFCFALLLSTSAVAQAGPTVEKSSDQIVCELAGDCEKVDPSLANQDQGNTRGFRIAMPGRPAAAAPAAAPAQAGARAVPQQRFVQPQRTQRFAVAQPGRSNLAINFVTGSASLADSGKHQADKFLQALAAPQLAGKRYKVIGHTDAVGNRAYNVDLSQRRARAVVDYLVAQGANRSQFDIEGKGFDDPLNRANPKAAENRRVEFVKLD